MSDFLRVANVTIKDRKFTVRTAFHVEKMLNEISSPTMPNAKLMLYNLSPQSRSFIESNVGANSKATVRLDVGYALGKVSLLFLGQVTRPTTKREGPDLISTLECNSNGLDVATSYLDISLDTEVNGDKIIDLCVNALGLKWGVVYSCSSVVFKHGFCWADQAWKCLQYIAHEAGMVAHNDNGVLNITPHNLGTGEPVVLLNKNTGLINFPSKTVDVTGLEGMTDIYMAESLVNPMLSPGRYVQIESSELTLPSRLVVRKATHEGDSKEGAWMSTIECTVPGAELVARPRRK